MPAQELNGHTHKRGGQTLGGFMGMSHAEWGLVKSCLTEILHGQKNLQAAIKSLEESTQLADHKITGIKNSVDETRKMIIDMVPEGNLFEHRLDHVHLQDKRHLVKIGRAKMVEYTIGAALGIMGTALFYYVMHLVK